MEWHGVTSPLYLPATTYDRNGGGEATPAMNALDGQTRRAEKKRLPTSMHGRQKPTNVPLAVVGQSTDIFYRWGSGECETALLSEPWGVLVV